MDGIESTALVVMGVALVIFIVVIADLVLPDERSRAERAQAEREQRAQAALEALRELGRKYPRPKNY